MGVGVIPVVGVAVGIDVGVAVTPVVGVAVGFDVAVGVGVALPLPTILSMATPCEATEAV